MYKPKLGGGSLSKTDIFKFGLTEVTYFLGYWAAEQLIISPEDSAKGFTVINPSNSFKLVFVFWPLDVPTGFQTHLEIKIGF